MKFVLNESIENEIEQFNHDPAEFVDKNKFNTIVSELSMDDCKGHYRDLILPNGKYIDCTYDSHFNKEFEIFLDASPSFIIPEDTEVYDKYVSGFIDNYFDRLGWVHIGNDNHLAIISKRPTPQQIDSVVEWFSVNASADRTYDVDLSTDKENFRWTTFKICTSKDFWEEELRENIHNYYKYGAL